jgi:hypothetical protein
MTSSIGKFTAAVAAVQNENSLSLANLNFDFTLIKLDAPTEFKGLGMTISKERKSKAEDGALHKTARKLGALFESYLPPAQNLIRPYGVRVSECQRSPRSHPSTPKEHKDGMEFLQVRLAQTVQASGLPLPQEPGPSRYIYLPACWLVY